MSQSEMTLYLRAATPTEYFAKRLAEHRKPIALTSDPAQHVAQLRAHIASSGLDCTLIGRAPDRKPETYAACFARLFGEALTPTTKRKGPRHVQTAL